MASEIPKICFRQNLIRKFGLCLVGCCWLVAGCAENTAIRTYKVSKADAGRAAGAVAGAEAKEQEMLAAIVPAADDAWFFKFRDVPDKVAKHRHEFRQIVESFNVDGGQPAWDLADGWSERQANDGFTYVRLVKEGEGIEATVTRLQGAPSGDTEAWRSYVLMNVNRWRRQLKLSDQAWDEMQADLEESPSLSTDSAKAYFVSIRGEFSSSGRKPPFASQAAASQPSEEMPAAKASKIPFEYDVPQGWKELDASGSDIRLAAFQAGDEAMVTVALAGGQIELNLGMWMQQVALEDDDKTKNEIIEASTKVSVRGAEASVYFVDGSAGQAILVADVPWGDGESMFIKLLGSSQAVEAAREAYFEFLSSIQ